MSKYDSCKTDSFCKLINVVLSLRNVVLSASLYIVHAKALESGLAKYPIRQVVCKTCTIQIRNLHGNHELIFTGRLPLQVVIVCVDNGAFN